MDTIDVENKYRVILMDEDEDVDQVLCSGFDSRLEAKDYAIDYQSRFYWIRDSHIVIERYKPMFTN